MIEAKDLRIGNYYRASIEFVGSVEAKLDPVGEQRIFILTEDKLILLLQLRNELLKFVFPITLTEDWLQRMGFDQEIKGHFENTYWDEDGGHKGLWVYSMLQAAKEYRNKYRVVVQNVNTRDAVFVKYIQYVHQLQNLFYTLTGEELTIKSDPIKA